VSRSSAQVAARPTRQSRQLLVNGTTPVAMDGHDAFELSVNMLRPPTHVRYTANQGCPQCALYDSNGLPLYPFQLSVTE
jgi:hypothetical protein